jgi:prophage DNA circulation protein
VTDTVDKIVIQSETQGIQQSTNDVQGLSKAMDGVTVASQNVEKSTGTIDNKFAALERRFSTTAGQATALARVQKSVNDAVAANPALQDRANEVWPLPLRGMAPLPQQKKRLVTRTLDCLRRRRL